MVVAATGLALLAVGGMALSVDGEPVDPGRSVAYKGMMLAGVPNLAFTIGYTTASWTLRSDLVAAYVCRLLAELDRTGARVVVPRQPPPGPRAPQLNLRANYVRRDLDRLPKQGASGPWRLNQTYFRDVLLFRHGPVSDEVEFR